jgi:hypothetical protein
MSDSEDLEFITDKGTLIFRSDPETLGCFFLIFTEDGGRRHSSYLTRKDAARLVERLDTTLAAGVSRGLSSPSDGFRAEPAEASGGRFAFPHRPSALVTSAR